MNDYHFDYNYALNNYFEDDDDEELFPELNNSENS